MKLLPTVFVLLAAAVAGQGPKAATNPKASTPLRTAWGAPDLQGVWDFATLTPMERPSGLAGKEALTEEEAAEFEKRTLVERDEDRRDRRPGVGGYNQFWWDYGTKVIGTRRTSLVVDPPDGKVPPMTPAGQKRAAARLAAFTRPNADGPEDRTLAERCILGFNAGPPMAPSAYNNNVQIFQTPQHVVLLNEMVNDSRVVPLDGRAHLPPDIRQWRGDSRGRWEGNTLVVDTANFRDQTNFRGASRDLRLTERFTRVDADTLLYEFTIDDPASWTKAWTAAVPMQKSAGPIFEYACHEGNYGMFNILAGSRAREKAAEEAAKKTVQ